MHTTVGRTERRLAPSSAGLADGIAEAGASCQHAGLGRGDIGGRRWRDAATVVVASVALVAG